MVTWPFRRRTRRTGTLWPVMGRYMRREQALPELVRCGYVWGRWENKQGAPEKPLFMLYHPARTGFLRYIVDAVDVRDAQAAGMRELTPDTPEPVRVRVFMDEYIPEGVPDTLGLSDL